MKLKYVIYPGMVRSRTDGQYHYIGSRKLMGLYGVDPSECVVFDPATWWPTSFYRMAEEDHKGLVKLMPQESGVYDVDQLGQENP